MNGDNNFEGCAMVLIALGLFWIGVAFGIYLIMSA